MEHEKRHRYTAWGLTWLAYATYYTGRKGFSVAKLTIERQLGVSREALGAIDTGYLIAYAVGQFVNGVLGDRVGARRLIGYGMLASAAVCAGFGLASGAVAFGVLFCVNGYAQSSGWPGTTRAMAEWTTARNRGTVMAFWATCYQVGGIAATAWAAWLLSRHGWRAAFTAPAAAIAVVGVLVLLLLRPGPKPVRAPDSSVPDEAAERRAALKAIFRSRTLWCYGASYFCIKLIRYSLLFWLPYYLADGLGYAEDDAGYLSTAFEIGGVFGVIVIGITSDRLVLVSRAKLAAAALVVLSGTLFLYARLEPRGWMANAVCLGLIGAFLFGPDALVSGAASQDAGGRHGAATATGFVNGMGSLGAILQGVVTVEVSRAYGWRSLFVVFFGLALVAAAVLLPSRNDRRPSAHV